MLHSKQAWLLKPSKNARAYLNQLPALKYIPIKSLNGRREFLDYAERAFEGASTDDAAPQVNVEGLYSQIGQLKVENDF